MTFSDSLCLSESFNPRFGYCSILLCCDDCWCKKRSFNVVYHHCPIGLRTLFDLNIKDVSQCVMPGVKKSNDVELQLHESDATDQTEVSTIGVRVLFVGLKERNWRRNPKSGSSLLIDLALKLSCSE